VKINWSIKHFSELTTAELYCIFRLRLAVFSVEQNCAYQDADGRDQESFHIMGTGDGGELLAYARILPEKIAFKEVSIGRVITLQKARGTGLGKELMQRSMAFIKEKFGAVPVRIGAQCYLRKFYEEFGFKVDGDEYLEDNIPHVEMICAPK